MVDSNDASAQQPSNRLLLLALGEWSLVSERTPTSAPSSANASPHQRPHSRAAELEPAVCSATTLVRREPFHETSSPIGCPRKRPKMIRLPTLASARSDGETPSNKSPALVSEVRGESASIFAHTRPRRGARQADLEPRQMARDYGRRIYSYNQFFNCLPGTDFAEGADHTMVLIHCYCLHLILCGLTSSSHWCYCQNVIQILQPFE